MCGSENESEAAFCRSCGSQFSEQRVGKQSQDGVKNWAEVLADSTDTTPPDRGNQVRCPFCGSKNVARYLYGLPTPIETWSKKDQREVKAGRIIMGGCTIVPLAPSHKCNKCGHNWSEENRIIESIAQRLHLIKTEEDYEKFTRNFLFDGGVQMAFRFASKAHAGQVDKLGEPYIYHPFSVAAKLDTPNEVMAALLHDVIEDTDATIDDLKYFPPEVVGAVKQLTKVKGVSYEEYLHGIRSNPLALRVKLADLAHNSDPERLALLEQQGEEGRKIAARLKEKYTKAYQILGESVDDE